MYNYITLDMRNKYSFSSDEKTDIISSAIQQLQTDLTEHLDSMTLAEPIVITIRVQTNGERDYCVQNKKIKIN